MPAGDSVVSRGSRPAAMYRPSGDQAICDAAGEKGTLPATGKSLTSRSDPPSADMT
jgi:hypothetical protein